MAAASFFLALAPLAQAQSLPDGVQLGMTVEQLRQAVPALRRVRHPLHMAGGLAGSWQGAAFELAGTRVVPTFFLADGQLRRIEYVAAAAGARTFDRLLAWGRSQWGPELASQGREGSYATWTQGELEAYLQQPNAPQRAQPRLVIRQQVLKDASEL